MGQLSTKIIKKKQCAHIADMHSSNKFLEFKGIGDIAEKLVETVKDIIYQLVYLLLKLHWFYCDSRKVIFSNKVRK